MTIHIHTISEMPRAKALGNYGAYADLLDVDKYFAHFIGFISHPHLAQRRRKKTTMSDNCCFLTIDNRAFVTSFAQELSPEEVYQVAYVWLQKASDIDQFAPSCKTRASNLELFAKLERLGIFSSNDVSGLKNIAKKINRSDLVEKVDAFTKDMKKKWKNSESKSETKSVKRKDSDERKELEKTFETMVVLIATLEQHISLIQKTLCQQTTDIELVEESKELIEHSSEFAQQLALNLSQAQKRLVSRSRTNSSASGSSGGNSSRPGSGEVLPESPCKDAVHAHHFYIRIMLRTCCACTLRLFKNPICGRRA